MATPFQNVVVSLTRTVDVELPKTGLVWKPKSERAIVVGGYALTMAEVIIPKLPGREVSAISCLLLVELTWPTSAYRPEEVRVGVKVGVHEASVGQNHFQSEDLISHKTVLGRHVGEAATLHESSIRPYSWRPWS